MSIVDEIAAKREAKRLPREFDAGRYMTRGLYYLGLFLLLILALASLFPLYWMISGSFKIQTAAIKIPPEWFPTNPTVRNYEKLFFGGSPTLRWFANSFIVASGIAFGAVVTSSLAGYAFGKKRFPGRNLLFWAMILTMMLPRQISLIPLFVLMRDLRWFNSFQGMIAPYIAYPFGVFLMRQYMQNVPSDLIDAARIDGASEIGIFRHVVFPLSKPVIGALGIFSFILGWNAYLWQLLIGNTKEWFTLPVGVSKLASSLSRPDIGLAMAGATVAFLPMLMVFLFFQDYFIKGITMGSLKG